MRAVVQRVSEASVEVDGCRVSVIGCGLLVLLGVEREDTEREADDLASRIPALRIFSDEQGRMNRSLVEAAGEVLLVSQFTLVATLDRGRRPGFDRAAPADRARALYERTASSLAAAGVAVRTGVFGAMMRVRLVNDGPVTFVLDGRAS